MSSLSLPVCSCCHRHIMPNDKCVKFSCPECGNEASMIWRCQSCREAATSYKCTACGFEGP